MSFTKIVKNKDGENRRVVADTEEQLEYAAKQISKNTAQQGIDINDPKMGNVSDNAVFDNEQPEPVAKSGKVKPPVPTTEELAQV